MSAGTRPPTVSTGPAIDPSLILLTENFPPAIGGSANLFAEIYRRVDVGGVQAIAAMVPGAPAEEPFGRSGRVSRPFPRQDSWGLLDASGRAGYRRLVTALRTAAAGRHTVVHAGRALPEALAARWGRLRMGCPYVCWAHGEEIGYVSSSWELAALARVAYGGAAVIVANCHNTERLLTRFGVDPARIEVVYPGVESSPLQAASGEAIRRTLAPAGEPLALTVGRLEARKGHDLMIKAVAELARRGHRVQYAIVGDGPERERLQALASAEDVAACVHFEGAAESARLPEYYAACDVFALPNRAIGGDVEGFGITFLEAAAAGKPTIGGRSGGVPEAVEDGVTGILVDGTDVAQLATALEGLLESADRRAAMGAAGLARVRARFTWERAAQQIETIHERVRMGRGRA